MGASPSAPFPSPAPSPRFCWGTLIPMSEKEGEQRGHRLGLPDLAVTRGFQIDHEKNPSFTNAAQTEWAILNTRK